jgi:hypothetical protein
LSLDVGFIAMTDLEDAMEKYMKYLVNKENRPFSYKEFLRFCMKGRDHTMTYGIFRNWISELREILS